ncbi:MAG: hypothetical protein E6I09_04215 [Chloroflexi bacterium]|jgi:hypothetical protein|nr:MAG: hypothetical protein E6I09_04215 [Chloroflexota bacterium]
MTEKILAVITSLMGLGVVAAIIGAITLTALAATGGPSETNGCRSDQANASGQREVRGINNEDVLATAWQTKWSTFDQQLDAGQPASVSFTESESTSRATRYLDSKEAPLKDLIICFHDGEAEASGKVKLPVLGDLPGVGGAFESQMLARGTIDFSGAQPKITMTKFEAGNLPSSAADRLKGQVENMINDRLDDLNLQHKYTPTFSEGSIEISGTP